MSRDYRSLVKLDYEFCPNESLLELFDMAEIAQVAGKLQTSKLTQFLYNPEDYSGEGQAQNSELTIVSTLEEHDLQGKTDSCFTGCAFASPEELIMADWNNGAIKMFNKYGILMDKLEFSNCPWDVTECYSGQVAVTVPKDTAVYFVDCGEHLKCVSSFITDCECFGIAKMGEMFVITCDPWSNSPSVRLFSVTGQPLSIYQFNNAGELLFKCPLHVCTDYFENIIYVSDSSADAVYAITLKGEIKFIYEHFDLRYPTGVKTDRFNRLYVCGKESSNIHNVSEKGDFIGFFCRHTDGVGKPTAMCFNPDGGSILFTDLQSSTCNGFLTKTLE